MIDVLILCAIPVEWDAVKELFAEHKEESLATDPAIVGIIRRPGRVLSAALVEVGVGSVSVSMSALTAVKDYQPKLVAFVGVAGGRKDVHLGDVVIASKVHYYETGKSVDGQFLARPNSPSSPHAVSTLARTLLHQFNNQTFKLHVGAIASGESVIADSNPLRHKSSIRTMVTP